VNYVNGKPEYEFLNSTALEMNIARAFLGVTPYMRVRARLPILDWLESEFITPTGPLKGQRYSRFDQPATTLFLQLTEDDWWRTIHLVAPNQCGKSQSFIHYILNRLFNVQEDIIFGVPTIEKGMWHDKYQKDILPVIEKSRSLLRLMPQTGLGTKGGTPPLIQFANGQSLQAMGAGGSAQARAGSTARIVAITEVKDFGGQDATGEGSKYDQMVARTLASQGREVVASESTLTTTDNIAWKLYLDGTRTMPYFPCESCEWYIAPEREHLVGWQDARTSEEARDKTVFSCPVCGVLIPEAKRKHLLREAKALHYGQTVENGVVLGPDGLPASEHPPTRALSYRITASTNMFADAGTIGVKEWAAKHETSPVRRRQLVVSLRQQYYAEAVDASEFELTQLDGGKLSRRVAESDISVLPARTKHVFVGVDVRKSQVHWVALAILDCGQPIMFDWSEEPILQDIENNQAIQGKIRELQGRFRDGWRSEDGSVWRSADFVMIDANWKTTVIKEVVALDSLWMPLQGKPKVKPPSKQEISDLRLDEKEKPVFMLPEYVRPKSGGTAIRFIGEYFHLQIEHDGHIIYLDANYWKARLHESLMLPLDDPMAMKIANASQAQRDLLIAHLMSEREIAENVNGQSVLRFLHNGQPNHLADAASYANLGREVHRQMEQAGLLGDREPEEVNPIIYGDGPLFGKGSGLNG
jgi:hypothetical protein